VRYARVVAASAGVQLNQLAGQAWILFFLLAEPFMVSAVALAMMGGRPDIDATYIVIGAALIGLLTGFLFLGGTQMNQERGTGTLEILAGCPAPLFVVVTGKVAGSVAVNLIGGAVAGFAAVSLFGHSLHIADPAAFVASAFLAVACLWGMGMLFTPLTFLWPEVSGIMTGLQYPVYVLGGFLFPIALLPEGVQAASSLLPAYWAATALHGASSGEMTVQDLLPTWTALVGAGASFTLVAVWSFGKAADKARREGRLGGWF
jgi:ABC-2 type transport system permease protein